jgi:hypothetical protein
MREAAAGLTNTEEKTLRTIVVHFAEEPFTCESLESAAPWDLTGYEAEKGVAGLRRRGIVVTRKKAWGERLHMLAEGVFGAWQQAYIGLRPEEWTESAESVEPIYEPRRDLAAMLFGLLSYARRNGLQLTQRGTLHKRDLQRLAERLNLSDEGFSGFECAYMHQDKYPVVFAILYDAALRLGLIRNGLGQAVLDEQAVKMWLSQSGSVMNERLLSLWWQIYTPSDVWLQHAAAMLQALPGGRWASVSCLAQRLRELGAPLGGRSEAEASAALRSHWLLPMRALGWLEFGMGGDDAGEVEWFRWKPAFGPQAERDGAEDGWYVQPDFEIIVTPGVSYSRRFDLEALAVYEGGDEVERYRLTKEAWEAAMDAGQDVKNMIENLRSGAKYGIPANVEDTLREWGERYGNVAVEQVTLLRCRDILHAEEIRQNPMTQPYILAALGDRDFIVRADQADELLALLERQGYSPRKASAREEHPGDGKRAAGDTGAGMSEGIVYSKRSAAIFPIDPNPPDVTELETLTGSVPHAWVKQFRRYHASTVRDVIETAIRIRTAVKLGRDDEVCMFYPRRMERSANCERAVGYIGGDEVALIPEEWSEVQLLLPE